MNETGVLIAGAGPTGLTLAIELARRDVDVRLIDQADSHFVGSRGDGMQPRTLEVFEDLGVLDAILAASAEQYPVKVYLDGEFVTERWMSEPVAPTPAVPYPNVRMLGQSQIEGILRERLAELGVRVELGTALTGFTQDDLGVTAVLSRDGAEETVRAAYLAGADGGKSVVRKTLGIAFEGTTDETIRMLLGDVRAEGLDHAAAHWFARAAAPMDGVVFTPLAGTPYFQFGSPLGERETRASLAALQSRLDSVSGGGVRLHDLAWSTVWRPNTRLAEAFRRGRVFLAGDAAHVHPPTGGQGLNTGVQDAYNLGWKLADGSAELLDSYEPERRTVAARVLGLSTELLDKYVAGDEAAHRRGPETRQLDLGYRGGPLAAAGSGDLRPGDRAPDAPVVDATGKPVRLFELFRGPHATELVFGDGPVAADFPGYRILETDAADAAGTGTDLVDAGGHAHAAYGVGSGARVVVRPDGYVWSVARAGGPAAGTGPRAGLSCVD
ncbi:FAD-dependent monooxygenase [Amycolatopsis sp. PS_44_ISF1]|uniref:FAD-dependent monooxygenase n=1 Tax=Amycolatopsis sp. PS_44_ISF1 TaxID=2974917 RepID=UPI0028E0171A|nr:FAD-dependent monooxygenase [Amycolatopsis sp. PS_44_ISF1]MDT8909447.1 FAD-dependent monooxygenase [Amycolatopsis sp. PS_44_ISF1]